MIIPLVFTLLCAQTETATSTEDLQPTATATPSFVKGELATAGGIRLVPRQSFIGVRLGFLLQEKTLYMVIAPKVDLLFLEDKLRIGFEVPLNLEFYSAEKAADNLEAKKGFEDFGKPRAKDYDDARDYMKILRYIQYGRKEDPFFFSIGQLFATTIGHGQAMRRYTANLDFDSTRVGAEIDAYGDPGGFELTVADVTRGNLFSGLVFVKPLALFTHDWMPKSFSIGASWTSDQKAPITLKRGPIVGGAAAGPILFDDVGNPQFDSRTVNVYGVDSELKVVKNESVDLKTYVDFSKLANAGNGFTLGVLGRFNFRSDSVLQLLRTRIELRNYDPNFQPSYFDVLYEFQKFALVTDATNSVTPPTKLASIASRTGSRRFGAYLEASYSVAEWFTVAAALEIATGGDDNDLMLHAEIPWRFINLFVTYHQRNFDKLFTFDLNDVLYAGARLQLLPILFVNGRIQKNIVWDPAENVGLGGPKEQLNYQADVEFGYEF